MSHDLWVNKALLEEQKVTRGNFDLSSVISTVAFSYEGEL